MDVAKDCTAMVLFAKTWTSVKCESILVTLMPVVSTLSVLIGANVTTDTLETASKIASRFWK